LQTPPLPAPGAPPAGDGPIGLARGSRRWRGITGSLAAGLVVLALALLGERALSLITPVPAPVLPTLLGFPVAAVLASSRSGSDHGRGRPAGIAAAAVLVITAATLLLFWWD
jgi:hypothetical protein